MVGAAMPLAARGGLRVAMPLSACGGEGVAMPLPADRTEGMATALPADERPFDSTPVRTEDLPPTPVRDRNIPADAWVEAPAALLRAGDDIGNPPIAYKRRLGRWLLWRAGPARGADARYVAVDSADLARHCAFRLFPDGSGSGTGPSGRRHDRFREWKQDLHDD